MFLVSKKKVKNKLVRCECVIQGAYLLCVWPDRTLAFSLQGQLPRETYWGTSEKRVAWGHVEAA